MSSTSMSPLSRVLLAAPPPPPERVGGLDAGFEGAGEGATTSTARKSSVVGSRAGDDMFF